ncbi:hypothetical protein N7458_001044 [Penicillium daleae]|uniref:Uncharacterized protein n=1 Tax=Penicillium daleae TaxID=63821 RepID=A0AAD6G805_9EURO|nr:hypothetical protein N7458_001044 [Penicillium daleae]
MAPAPPSAPPVLAPSPPPGGAPGPAWCVENLGMSKTRPAPTGQFGCVENFEPRPQGSTVDWRVCLVAPSWLGSCRRPSPSTGERRRPSVWAGWPAPTTPTAAAAERTAAARRGHRHERRGTPGRSRRRAFRLARGITPGHPTPRSPATPGPPPQSTSQPGAAGPVASRLTIYSPTPFGWGNAQQALKCTEIFPGALLNYGTWWKFGRFHVTTPQPGPWPWPCVRPQGAPEDGCRPVRPWLTWRNLGMSKDGPPRTGQFGCVEKRSSANWSDLAESLRHARPTTKSFVVDWRAAPTARPGPREARSCAPAPLQAPGAAGALDGEQQGYLTAYTTRLVTSVVCRGSIPARGDITIRQPAPGGFSPGAVASLLRCVARRPIRIQLRRAGQNRRVPARILT